MVKRDLTADEQESVLHWIASGKFLRVWCRTQAALDPSSTADAIRQRVDAYKNRTPEFATAYEQARLIGADEIAQDAVDFIDTEPGRTVTGGYDSAEVAWRKNQAYFRMEALKKWFPQKYGDKVTQDVTVKSKVEELTDDELAATLAIVQRRIAGNKAASGDGASEKPEQAP